MSDLTKRLRFPYEPGVTDYRWLIQNQRDAADHIDALSECLREMVGQVCQARDGFGIWPYKDSDSMNETLLKVSALLGEK